MSHFSQNPLGRQGSSPYRIGTVYSIQSKHETLLIIYV